jgi:mono/diheme cytochrome c family protein
VKKKRHVPKAASSVLMIPLLILSASFAGGLALADINPYEAYGSSSVWLDSGYVRNAVPLNQELSFESLRTLIDKQKVTSVERLLEVLPDNMKQDNYVLVYRSRSLQAASPTEPRVIMYTPTATLTLAFNGGKVGAAGANHVELIQYRATTQKFEFRELIFDGTGAPQVSAANPKQCIQCHQGAARTNLDLRPNWEPYSTWIGVYGSNDGTSSELKSELIAEKKARPQDEDALNEQKDEGRFFNEFFTNIAPGHARYSQLGHYNAHAPLDITNHLQVWNLMRTARLMHEETEIYNAYADLIAMSARCYNLDYIGKNRFMDWAREQKTDRHYFHYGSATQTSEMITQIFEPLGVDTSDWSMDFGTGGRFAFYQRFGTPSTTEQIFNYAWNVALPGAAAAAPQSCTQLQANVEKNLGAFFKRGEHLRIQASHRRPAISGAEVATRRCATCHDEAASALVRANVTPALPTDWGAGAPLNIPLIAFARPTQLAIDLRRPSLQDPQQTLLEVIAARTSDMARSAEQMPPAQRLSSEEQAALLAYLRQL